MPDFASPASMSIYEEVTRAAVTVLIPVFNNLVLFDQHKERNTIDTIVPDLAESWTWTEDGKELTFADPLTTRELEEESPGGGDAGAGGVAAWIADGDCSRRVVRGGCWGRDPGVLRAADRDVGATGLRSNGVGFRVGRTLTPIR